MKYWISLFLLFSGIIAKAQNTAEVEMADAFRAEGKIYVVLAVILIILFGLFFYLVRIDRKLTKIEKDKNIDG